MGTKGMIFNKTGKFIRRSFQINNSTIKTVREYKYLGFLLTPSGEINSGLRDLKARAAFALAQLKGKLGENFRKYYDITMELFNAFVKPIILYLHCQVEVSQDDSNTEVWVRGTGDLFK